MTPLSGLLDAWDGRHHGVAAWKDGILTIDSDGESHNISVSFTPRSILGTWHEYGPVIGLVGHDALAVVSVSKEQPPKVRYASAGYEIRSLGVFDGYWVIAEHNQITLYNLNDAALELKPSLCEPCDLQKFNLAHLSVTGRVFLGAIS
jgi:hypothetical protein